MEKKILFLYFLHHHRFLKIFFNFVVVISILSFSTKLQAQMEILGGATVVEYKDGNLNIKNSETKNINKATEKKPLARKKTNKKKSNSVKITITNTKRIEKKIATSKKDTDKNFINSHQLDQSILQISSQKVKAILESNFKRYFEIPNIKLNNYSINNILIVKKYTGNFRTRPPPFFLKIPNNNYNINNIRKCNNSNIEKKYINEYQINQLLDSHFYINAILCSKYKSC